MIKDNNNSNNADEAGALVFKEDMLSILIPVYNERPYLRRLVEQVMAAPLPGNLKKEIIIVDDCSTDGSRDIIAGLEREYPETIRAVFQDKNQGKGAAIRRAVREMTGHIAIFQDADLEYDPGEYSFLINPILSGDADVVYGSRFSPRTMKRVLNYHHALGNRFLTFLSNFFTGLDLTDMETCYKAFRADILKTVPLRSNRFGIEPEITAKVAKRNCRVYEVPISYRGRSYSEGKKIGWKDGVSAIFTIIRYALIDDCFNEQYGRQILSTLSLARRFNKSMIRALVPYLGSRILEIGAGIGNISRQLPLREKLIVSDKDGQHIRMLAEIFLFNDLVEIRRIDITEKASVDALGENACDTILCLNVLEHVDDDVTALNNMRGVLEDKGKLILLLPQYQCLYGSYDKYLGHYRRYNRKALCEKLEKAGLAPVVFRNFNFLSIFGWFINSKILRKKRFSKWQIKIMDILAPYACFIESVVPLPGTSLICVAEKTDARP